MTAATPGEAGRERAMDDAPIQYSADEANAWAAGYNAALADRGAALRHAVTDWAARNEIAAPPLDWRGLGDILKPPGDAPAGTQVEDTPGEAARAAVEGGGAEARTLAERPERLPTSPERLRADRARDEDDGRLRARIEALCDEALVWTRASGVRYLTVDSVRAALDAQ